MSLSAHAQIPNYSEWPSLSDTVRNFSIAENLISAATHETMKWTKNISVLTNKAKIIFK